MRRELGELIRGTPKTKVLTSAGLHRPAHNSLPKRQRRRVCHLPQHKVTTWHLPVPGGEPQPLPDSSRPAHSSLPKMQRRRVFQAFSVPGAKIFRSCAPWGLSVTTARNLTTTPNGKTHRKKLRMFFSLWVRAFLWVVNADRAGRIYIAVSDASPFRHQTDKPVGAPE